MRLTAIVSSAALSMMSSKSISMHWFRKGLRLHDNPALLHALEKAKKGEGGQFYPVYVIDGDCFQLKHCSAIRANFLVECLADLDHALREMGSRLYVVSGDPTEVLPKLWEDWDVSHLTYEAEETGEPYATKRDETIMKLSKEKDIEVETFCSETLFSLDAYVLKSGGLGKVPGTMGKFQGIFGKMGKVPKPLKAPTKIDFTSLDQKHIEDLEGQMLPPSKATDLPWPRNTPKKDVRPIWGSEDCKNLTPIVHGGESLGLEQLWSMTAKSAWVASFEKPKTSCTALKPSTTGISPFMSLGCLSPRTVWYAISEAIERAPASTPVSKPPVSLHGQMLWRDFNNLIAHSANRETPGSWGQIEGNKYCRFVGWQHNERFLEAWKHAKTGYPWIDACMMQLKTEGWMHHLGRHAVACFLTRGDLWQSWEEGAAYFESQLLDADYALNGFNWLWLSCSGFFYQYFRCYSPVSFQKKKDPNGN
jgi:cryptochrome